MLVWNVIIGYGLHIVIDGNSPYVSYGGATGMSMTLASIPDYYLNGTSRYSGYSVFFMNQRRSA